MKILRSLFLALSGLATLAAAAAAEDPPLNIVVYIVDDMSPDAGCYGNEAIRTPHIDALAAEGVRFTHAFATTASCSASRSVILTGIHNHLNGQYGHQHDFHGFESWLRMRGLPILLEECGYRTAQIGKLHVAPYEVYRFERYLPGNSRSPAQMANNCREFIAADDDRPFFLYFATSDPHRGGGRDDSSPHRPDRFGNRPDGYPGIDEVTYAPEDVIVPEFLPDTPASRAELAQYYQSVSRLDQGVGRLMEILRETGKLDRTVVLFTADHGMAFPGAKTNVYDAALRVPFIVRHPNSPERGIVNPAMISFVDLAPTLLDIAGGYDPEKRAPIRPDSRDLGKPAPGANWGPPYPGFHGRSFLPVLDSTNSEGWDEIAASHTFHEIQMYYPMRVVRDREYKLIWNVAHDQPFPFASDLWAAATWQAQFQQGPDAPYGAKTVRDYIHRPEFEFFRIADDPAESSNLADDPAAADVLERYKKKLRAFQDRTGDPWIMKWNYE